MCAFLWSVLFGGKVLLPADMLLRMEPWRHYAAEVPEIGWVQNPMLDPIQQYYPWRTYAARTVRSGELPLWNPYMFCGAPFVGNGQSAVFYPVNALFYLMWPARAFGYTAALNLLLAGAFTFLFLRSMEQRRWASLLGAIVFSYCGFMVVWLEFPTFLATGLWLPAALLFFQRSSLSTVGGRHGAASAWSAACGCSIACMLVGGHLQIAFYALLAVGGFALCRMVQLWRQSGRDTARLARCAVLAVGLGLALSAVHVLPVLGTGRGSSRAASPQYGGALELRLRWPNAVTFLVPDLLRIGIFYETWDEHPLTYIETCGYVGVAPLLLAPLGLAWRRRGDGWVLGALLVVALLLAFGTALNYIFFRFAPGYAVFRGIGRAVYLSSFVLAVLAARGAGRIGDGMLRDVSRQRIRLVALCAGAAIVAAGIALVEVGRGGHQWIEAAEQLAGVDLVAYQWTKIGLFAAFGLATVLAAVLVGHWRPRAVPPLLVGLIVADLFIFGYRFNPKVDASVLRIEPESKRFFDEVPRPVRVLVHAPADNPLRTMPSNLPMLWELQDVGGSDTVVWAPYERLRKALSEAPGRYGHHLWESPALDLLNVEYALVGPPLRSSHGWLHTVPRWPDMWMPHNPEAMPRAFVTYMAPRRLAPEECLTEMLRPDWLPWEPMLLAEAEAPGPAYPALRSRARRETETEFTPAEVVAYEANRVVIHAEAQGDGLLVLGDTCMPGWRAFVDGAEQPILRTDYILRGVRLAPGEHHVEFVYLPAAFTVGAFLACLGLCLVAAIATRRAIRARVLGRRQ